MNNGWPPRTLVDASDQLLVRTGPQRPDLLTGLGEGERDEWHVRGHRQSASADEPLGVRRGDGVVVGAPGAHHRRPTSLGEVLEQVEGRRVGPVQVLEHEAEGLQVGQPRQEQADRREQVLLREVVLPDRCIVLVELGEQPGQRAADEPGGVGDGLLEPGAVVGQVDGRQQVDEGEERRFGGQRQAAAGRDECAAGARRRRDEGGLADAGLASDEEQSAAGPQVASYGGELEPASGDRRRGGGSAVGGGAGGEPELVEVRGVARHRLDDQLEGAPGGEDGGGERLGDGGV